MKESTICIDAYNVTATRPGAQNKSKPHIKFVVTSFKKIPKRFKKDHIFTDSGNTVTLIVYKMFPVHIKK
jgi:hypothetical protein